jgi:hypothetical protein
MRHIPNFRHRNNVSPHADSLVAMCRRKTWGKTGIYTRSRGVRIWAHSSSMPTSNTRRCCLQRSKVNLLVLGAFASPTWFAGAVSWGVGACACGVGRQAAARAWPPRRGAAGRCYLLMSRENSYLHAPLGIPGRRASSGSRIIDANIKHEAPSLAAQQRQLVSVRDARDSTLFGAREELESGVVILCCGAGKDRQGLGAGGAAGRSMLLINSSKTRNLHVFLPGRAGRARRRPRFICCRCQHQTRGGGRLQRNKANLIVLGALMIPTQGRQAR